MDPRYKSPKALKSNVIIDPGPGVPSIPTPESRLWSSQEVEDCIKHFETEAELNKRRSKVFAFKRQVELIID